MATTAVLVVAGGLAVGGTFGLLERETERASNNQAITADFTSWHLTTVSNGAATVYVHAPHFGIPVTTAGLLTIVGALLLVFGRGRFATLARPVAVASAALLVGTVWSMAMVLSANFDSAHHEAGFDLVYTAGIGFWLLLAAAALAVVGGVLALLAPGTDLAERVEPATPRYGIPALGQPTGQPIQGQPIQGQPIQGHPYPAQQQYPPAQHQPPAQGQQPPPAQPPAQSSPQPPPQAPPQASASPDVEPPGSS
jgi:hypothetical protein